MKTREEIRDWLLDNAVDEDGDLMLHDLDFSEFGGNIHISGMKVNGDLIQTYHEVNGDLIQTYHEVKGDLIQNNHEVKGDLFQSDQKVKGSLYQSGQEVHGNYYCSDVKVKGYIFADEPTKLLQEITLEELAELGYKLKGGNINETK